MPENELEKNESTDPSTSDIDSTSPDEDEDERMWAAISFVVILIVIGVPLWWKLTEVERSYFPYDDISDLRFRNITFPLNISIKTPFSSTNLVNDLHQLFLESSLFRVNIEATVIKKFYEKSVTELEAQTEIHPPYPENIQLIELASLNVNGKIVVGKHRTVYFQRGAIANEVYKFLQEVMLNEEVLKESVKSVLSPGTISENSDYLRKVRPSPKYDVIFTVVNPQPEKIDFRWNNELIIECYFRSTLERLALLSEFRVKSQWLYLLDWQQTPKKVNGRFELNQKQIPHIITPLEKKIGSGVARNPCINFVLHITKCEFAPTVFVDEQGKASNAILSARWGGVQIVNPNKTNCENGEPLVINSRNIMQIFLVQFKRLLGLSSFLSLDKVLLTNNTIVVHSWEIDMLYRMRVLEQFIMSRITLTSLSQLLGEINNIVITEEVSDAVLKAAIAAQNTLDALARYNLTEALNFSTQSFISSEFAFTHPSLLALLYFPDDQKYAVYIPLYLPVMIPVLLSLKNIQAWLKKKYFKKVDVLKKND